MGDAREPIDRRPRELALAVVELELLGEGLEGACLPEVAQGTHRGGLHLELPVVHRVDERLARAGRAQPACHARRGDAHLRVGVAQGRDERAGGHLVDGRARQHAERVGGVEPDTGVLVAHRAGQAGDDLGHDGPGQQDEGPEIEDRLGALLVAHLDHQRHPPRGGDLVGDHEGQQRVDRLELDVVDRVGQQRRRWGPSTPG